MANLLGKRMTCADCGAQVLITKGGQGQVECCNQPMQLVEAKPLPSAD
ncbi:MAG: hypothetical protein EPO21_03700 [Chloroflexota bacterium]|nr:MAG: hypothetical protein EPO21_03700 [Chloroflexota bacterium]